MTQEEKQLLLKDLCARLPYGVYIKHIPTGIIGKLNDIHLIHYYNNTNSVQDMDALIRFFGDDYTDVKNIKPYLRPMSSMTEEEKEYRMKLIIDIKHGANIDKLEDFYHSHHFDYYGLIEKGLALEAPEDMYKNE